MEPQAGAVQAVCAARAALRARVAYRSLGSSPPSYSWQLVGILWTPHEDLGSGETGQVWHGCDLVTRAPASHPSCSLTLGSMSVHPTGWGWRQLSAWLFLSLALALLGDSPLSNQCGSREASQEVTGLHSQLMLVSAVATPKSWQQLQTKSLLSPTNRNQGKKRPSKNLRTWAPSCRPLA